MKACAPLALLCCAVLFREAASISFFSAPAKQSSGVLAGISLPRAADGKMVDLGAELDRPGQNVLCVLGTYAADFNAIEYGQLLRHYAPKLKDKVGKTILVLNAERDSCQRFAELLDLPKSVEILSDPEGKAGLDFGVGRGWLPDAPVSPYVKLFGMLWGLGAPKTLVNVIAGYIGNPGGENGWITDAMAANQRAGRWPDSALELGADGAVAVNKFDELPIVGGWGRRPLELATLRLQNMLGISLENWEELKPTDLQTLTQLGGCVVVDGENAVAFEHRDSGICGCANFEELLRKL